MGQLSAPMRLSAKHLMDQRQPCSFSGGVSSVEVSLCLTSCLCPKVIGRTLRRQGQFLWVFTKCYIKSLEQSLNSCSHDCQALNYVEAPWTNRLPPARVSGLPGRTADHQRPAYPTGLDPRQEHINCLQS